MKLTESRLRYAIRDLLWEASVSSSGDPDANSDGKLSAAELRRIADDMDRARSGKLGSDVQGHQAAYDLSDERAVSQGRIPFLDWSQLVADASSTLNGIQDLGSAADGSKDGYHPETGERITPYDAWIDNVDPAVYAQSIDALAPGDMGADDWDEMKWSMNELGILPGGKLGKFIMENMYDENPQTPWVFGPEGYDKRPVLDLQAKNKADIGTDSPPEVMIARAMAYRASELTNYQKEFDDEIFSDYAMRSYQDYVVGKAGDRFQALDSMLNRIDDGGWDDEEIMEIAMGGEYDSSDYPDSEYPGMEPSDDFFSDREANPHDGSMHGEPEGGYIDESGPLSESRLIHLAGLKED